MDKIPYTSILTDVENHMRHILIDIENLVKTVDEQKENLKKADIRITELEEQVNYYKELYNKEQELNLQLQNRMDLV